MAWTLPRSVAHILAEHHYLGPLYRGLAWADTYGVIIVTAPTARHIPQHWLELARWCITSRVKNGGSQQWAAFYRALRRARPEITTVVSYSDPSRGHTGALYRACNWLYAPTWHRLRPPPSGGGSWDGVTKQATKDRWVYPVRRDAGRVDVLTMKDESVLKKTRMGTLQRAGRRALQTSDGGDCMTREDNGKNPVLDACACSPTGKHERATGYPGAHFWCAWCSACLGPQIPLRHHAQESRDAG